VRVVAEAALEMGVVVQSSKWGEEVAGVSFSCYVG